MTERPEFSGQEELSDDIEVIGPGQMLADARRAQQLSVEEVAKRLNFTLTLVQNIEADRFDDNLPATYTRGYLKNYAKLVNLPESDVLASYEMLGVAKVQGAEMQSFSRITKKQAENSRLMWISYFVLAVLISLTVVWWLQDVKPNSQTTQPTKAQQPAVAQVTPSISTQSDDSSEQQDAEATITTTADDTLPASAPDNTEPGDADTAPDTATEAVVPSSAQDAFSTVVFRFSGDCWVNIYDATGERIAWGIKKSGYVMTISGQPPFDVTLGKPELVAISFDNVAVDMTQFNAGNIAKFSLPLNP